MSDNAFNFVNQLPQLLDDIQVSVYCFAQLKYQTQKMKCSKN